MATGAAATLSVRPEVNSTCYLTGQNHGVAIQAFKEKGISNMMPASIDDVQYLASPPPRSMYFLTFISFTVAFAQAQLYYAYSLAVHVYKNVFKPVIVTRTFEVPVVTFVFQNLSNEQKDQLRSYGLIEGTVKGRFTGSPNPIHMADIYRLGPIAGSVPPGHVNLSGYQAYVYALKGFQIYSSLVRKVIRTNGTWVADRQHLEDLDTSMASVNMSLLGQDTPSSEPYGVGEMGIGNMSFTGEPTALIGPYNDLRALPGAYVELANIDSLPDVDGIFFPYFTGMLQTDKSMLHHVFSTLFVSGLADTPEKCVSMYSHIRSGFKNMAFTNAGKSLSHLYAGIKISMETGAEITAILKSGVYVGFTLHRKDLLVRLYGKEYRAIAKKWLLEDIRTLSKHDHAVSAIVSLVNSLLKEDGKPAYNISANDLSTSRGLVRVVQRIGIQYFQGTFLTQLAAEADKLVYGDRFALPSQATLMDALAYIHTGEMNHIDRYPSYISSGFILNRDRVSVALAIFGFTAPSLNYGTKGITFMIPNSTEKTDPNMTEVNGKIPLQYLPFSMEPIGLAVSQWNRLFSTGSFTLPNGRKNKKEFTDATHVDFKITKGPIMTEAYNRIKDHSIAIRAAVSGGKRKNAGDDGETGPSNSAKKQKKDLETMALDM